jgi:hypothetical protein
MRLFIYNKENTVSIGTRNGERTIRINRTNGVIYISKVLMNALKLKENEKLLFANDEDSPKDWYLCKTNDENGFVLKNDKTGIRFTNKYLSAKILDSVKIESNATFLVAKEPVNNNGVLYFKIITSSPVTISAKHNTLRKTRNK